ncbi:alkaline phosphatase PhoX [Frankia sp. QA3]|uniref:alkaline phosphatase PhoX n=1 Tax=Frankia sp. QA3 TaxID=710111 RepID=UPI000307A33A|nr:alkaline phosphatase PhoX [Frankia sp. QA3]
MRRPAGQVRASGSSSVPSAAPNPTPAAPAGFGALRPAGPELALPPGFRYASFGRAGAPMSDGLPTPIVHDGQALFDGGHGTAVLLRNHEIDPDLPGVQHRALGPREAYDRAAPAGVTWSRYGPGRGTDLAAGRLRESRLVLNGTLENCNGSPTPGGTWLSCEETTDGTAAGYERPHGYVFEVPVNARGPVSPLPLQAMGRFEPSAPPCTRRPASSTSPRTTAIPATGSTASCRPAPGSWRPAADARRAR